MATIRIVTPDNVEVEYRLASLGLRAAAAMIDFLIQGAVLLITGLVAVFIILFLDVNEETMYLILGIIIIVFSFLSYTYFVVSDLVMKGQTIGKRIYHLRIIRENGEGITFTHALIREFIRMIDNLGIGTILIFLSKKSKRIGDYAASTLVVEEEINTLMPYDLFYNANSKYPLTKEEFYLLRDYFSRKDGIDPISQTQLKQKLVAYFEKRFDLKTNPGDPYDDFLRNLMQE